LAQALAQAFRDGARIHFQPLAPEPDAFASMLAAGLGLASGVRRRPRQQVLLAYVLAGLCFVFLGPDRSVDFTEPGASASSQSLATRKAPRAGGEVSRSNVLRLLPLVTAGAGAAPSYGESGITKAWEKKPNGDDDDIHLGGVVWEDVKIGKGATPKIGQQIAVNFKVFCQVKEREVLIDDTKGSPRDYRWGIGQLLAGIDEGVTGMRTGGQRKMKIPGNLAFGNKAIPSKPGRPAIPPNTPIEAVVTLEFIPGADDVYEYGKADID